MKQQILNRYTSEVIYECELPDGTDNAMRAALIKAVAERAKEYTAALAMCEVHASIWTPKE